MPVRINVSLARGLRTNHGTLHAKINQAYLASLPHDMPRGEFLRYLRRTRSLLHETRRPPQPGKKGGFTVIWITTAGETGEIGLIESEIDKHGDMMPWQTSRLFLSLTRHAVESLYQRLHTTDRQIVYNELATACSELRSSVEAVINANAGMILTKTGVFPAVPCLSGQPDDSIDNCRYCLATTWISWEALENHTPAKKRFADLALAAKAANRSYAVL